MARNIQMIHSFTYDTTRGRDVELGKVYTAKSSFSTVEKAVENAQMFINKSESWIDVTTTKVEIINKETKEMLWRWEA